MSKNHAHNWHRPMTPFYSPPFTGCTSCLSPLLLSLFAINVCLSLSISFSLSPLSLLYHAIRPFSMSQIALSAIFCNFLSLRRLCCVSTAHTCHSADVLNIKLHSGGTRMGLPGSACSCMHCKRA